MARKGLIVEGGCISCSNSGSHVTLHSAGRWEKRKKSGIPVEGFYGLDLKVIPISSYFHCLGPNPMIKINHKARWVMWCLAGCPGGKSVGTQLASVSATASKLPPHHNSYAYRHTHLQNWPEGGAVQTLAITLTKKTNKKSA